MVSSIDKKNNNDAEEELFAGTVYFISQDYYSQDANELTLIENDRVIFVKSSLAESNQHEFKCEKVWVSLGIEDSCGWIPKHWNGKNMLSKMPIVKNTTVLKTDGVVSLNQDAVRTEINQDASHIIDDNSNEFLLKVYAGNFGSQDDYRTLSCKSADLLSEVARSAGKKFFLQNLNKAYLAVEHTKTLKHLPIPPQSKVNLAEIFEIGIYELDILQSGAIRPEKEKGILKRLAKRILHSKGEQKSKSNHKVQLFARSSDSSDENEFDKTKDQLDIQKFISSFRFRLHVL